VAFLVTFLPPPCLLFEDDDLLVVQKPPGINTHAPAPHHNEGLYDWLRHRDARWATLGLLHRLDKETSGVLLFTKSSRANRSLAREFAGRSVRKRYLLLTDRPVPHSPQTLRSALVRAGQHYISRPVHPGGDIAETRFQRLKESPGMTLVEAVPLTGRSHQVRVHAAALGFPILGDTHYGGTPAPRLCLHAETITIQHPATGKPVIFRADPDFDADPRQTLRSALVDPAETDAWRVIHGAGDGHPGWYVDRLGDQLLSQSAQPLSPEQLMLLRNWMTQLSCLGSSHKSLLRQPGSPPDRGTAPLPIDGPHPSGRFVIRENNVRFHVGFQEGYSIGLFLDQRDNRRRLLTGHVAAGFDLASSEPSPATILNTFAYTCAFSVCAAIAGARTTSIDLSRNHLDWGRDNFTLNQLDPEPHSFLRGDVFSWLRRLGRQTRSFDLILLDPPTFSRSKESGVFRAETDYHRLVTAALPCLKPGGVLFASSNAVLLKPEPFLDQVTKAITASGRQIQQQHYAPQPPDFPVARDEPAHLKSVWLRVR
jgi:23S rRNA (cytosine1962-C5)-methyltransferase